MSDDNGTEEKIAVSDSTTPVEDRPKIVIELEENHSGRWSIHVEGPAFREWETVCRVSSGNIGCCNDNHSAQNAGDALLEFLLRHAKALGLEFRIENLKDKRERERGEKDKAYREGKTKICPHCGREHAPGDVMKCDW